MRSGGVQLQVHVFGQTTAGQQQLVARTVADVLAFVTVDAGPLGGVQQFQQEGQTGIGAAGAGQCPALLRALPLARPRLAIGRIPLADALQAAQQGDGTGDGLAWVAVNVVPNARAISSGSSFAASPRVANRCG